MGAVLAFFAQPHIVSQIYGEVTGGFNQFLYASLKMLSTSVEVNAGNEMMTELACTDGMSGMMNTILLILCVIIFGGSIQASGMIMTITEKMIKFMNSTFSIVASTVGTGIFCNIALSDQYMAIILPSKMFGETYRKQGYAPELLSRSVEDSSTVTSVLVPWNTCAVAQSTVLGVATLTYLPYCIFNILSPIMSIFVAAIGWKIRRIPVEKETETITK
jgi:NhaC family Na+:H+ antiporter